MCWCYWESALKSYQYYLFLTVSDFSEKVMMGFIGTRTLSSLSVTLGSQNWQQQVRQWYFWHEILRNDLVILASDWPRTSSPCWYPRLFIIQAGSVSEARSRLASSQCLLSPNTSKTGQLSRLSRQIRGLSAKLLTNQRPLLSQNLLASQKLPRLSRGLVNEIKSF